MPKSLSILLFLAISICFANCTQNNGTTTIGNAYVPVFGLFGLFLLTKISVMMPLNIVTNEGQVNNPTKLYQNLQKLKSISMFFFWKFGAHANRRCGRNYD